jgi:8-oxo-dGTP diphosphatase
MELLWRKRVLVNYYQCNLSKIKTLKGLKEVINMILSTLCYIEKDEKYLMLHRTKKKNDINKDKWLGIGGKFQDGESPEECIKREVLEETGLEVYDIKLRCIVTYKSSKWESEYMYVFVTKNFSGNIIECDEGDLEWIDKNKITSLNTWEGDKIFLNKIQNESNFFTVKFEYDGEKLIDYKIYEY